MSRSLFLYEGRLTDFEGGRIDEAALAQCLEGITCEHLPEECRRAFVGRGGEGDVCLLHVECRPGLHCAGHPRATCGVCAPPIGPGEPCFSDEACRGHVGSAGPACVREDVSEPGVCGVLEVETVGVGETCGSEPPVDGRIVIRTCDAGAACLEGRCVAVPVAEGGACGFFLPCDQGLACVEGVCTAASSSGEPCVAYGVAAPVCDPRQDLSCSEGRCVPDPAVVGAPCERYCGGGLRCLDGVCTSARAIGERCNGDDDCAAGTCRGLELRCAPFWC